MSNKIYIRFQKMRTLIFIVIFLAASVIGLLLFFSFKAQDNTENLLEPADPRVNEKPSQKILDRALVEPYKNKIQESIRIFENSKDAETAYNELLSITVPYAEFRDFHLDLVILFDELRFESRQPDSSNPAKHLERLRDLKKQLESL